MRRRSNAASNFPSKHFTGIAKPLSPVRSECMLRAAEILEEEAENFGKLMVEEMGKPLKAAIDEAKKYAWDAATTPNIRGSAEGRSDSKQRDGQLRALSAARARARDHAVEFSVFAGFPVRRPALMAGNTGLLKHASNVPRCALAIEEIFLRAGFAEGVFQTLMIGSDMVPEVLEDPRVMAATLTGSEAAGASVASLAGREIKKTVLELGGSDPFIVMPSAVLNDALSTAVKARTINNGQSCIAAKRFIVSDRIYDDFERLFSEAMSALKVGDPMDPTTDVGPLATEKVLTDLEDQVRRAVHAGAHVMTGGHRIGERGYFYAPLF